MKRREFVSFVGFGSVVPLVITFCDAGTKEKSTLSPPGSDGFQAIGTVSDLNAKGQLLAEETAAGKVLVIPDPADSSRVVAINPTCTHAGCTVAWQKDQNAFVCPCHGSRFAEDGKVIQGPADQPLPTYGAKVEGGSVLVKVS